MASSVSSKMWPICLKFNRGICYEHRCSKVHAYKYCKDHQNGDNCNRKFCRFMHVSSHDQHEYEHTGLKGRSIVLEAERTRQLAGICQDFLNTGHCQRGENCRYTHTSPGEITSNQKYCPICAGLILAGELAVTKCCMHGLCISKDNNEYVLIQFVGDSETKYYIYNSSKLINNKNGRCTVRWQNKKFYEAKILYEGSLHNCTNYKHKLTHEPIVLLSRIDVKSQSTSGAEKYSNKSKCDEKSESCNKFFFENRLSEEEVELIEHHAGHTEAVQSDVFINPTSLSEVKNRDSFSKRDNYKHILTHEPIVLLQIIDGKLQSTFGADDTNKSNCDENSESCSKTIIENHQSEKDSDIIEADQTCSMPSNVLPEYENSSLYNILVNYNSSSSSESDVTPPVTQDSKPVVTIITETTSEDSDRVYIDASYSDDEDDNFYPIDDELCDPTFQPEVENGDHATDFSAEDEASDIDNNSENEDNAEPISKAVNLDNIEIASSSVCVRNNIQLENNNNGHNLSILPEINARADVSSFTSKNIRPAAEKKWTNDYHFCPFCKNRVTRFARHVLNIHSLEPDVVEINILPANCLERKQKIAALRKKGMFEYNTDEKFNKGDLIVNRRPCKVKKAKNYKAYIPCKNCKGFYQSANLAKHFKLCTGNKSARGVVNAGRMLAKKILPVYFENVGNILLHGRNDTLTQIILNDESILYYGAKLSSKYMHVRHMDNHIRSNMRQLARLYIALKKLDPTNKCLLDCLHPLKFNNVIVATYQICGYDKHDRTFKNPSAALHIGGILAKCCDALLVQFIQKDDQVKLKQIEDFLKLVKSEFPVMASVASASLVQKNIAKVKSIPLASDIYKLNDYLRKGATQAYDNLLQTYSYSDWYKLASYTLVLILIFNRKRTGETQRLTVNNYNAKSTIEKGSDVYDALSEHEKILCGNFHRIEIRGKWGRTVPLLLTKLHISYIDRILLFREQAGVSVDNPYVFGIGERSYLFAGKILRAVANECGASNPNTLRGTHLRKQIATVTQLIDMSDNDIKLLSQFMGHSQLIHEQHYRKADSTLQIARLSKLLMAFNDGNMERYKGCTLEDIDADLNEDILLPIKATSPSESAKDNPNTSLIATKSKTIHHNDSSNNDNSSGENNNTCGNETSLL